MNREQMDILQFCEKTVVKARGGLAEFELEVEMLTDRIEAIEESDQKKASA